MSTRNSHEEESTYAQATPEALEVRGAVNVPGGSPAFVSRKRILRLRQVMPDESPIDLDEHAAMIAYDVERQGGYAEGQRRRQYSIEVTRDYVEQVHRFLDEIREASSRLETLSAAGAGHSRMRQR